MDIYVCISSEMRMCMSVCPYNQLVPSFPLSFLYFNFMDSHTCNMVRNTDFNFILCISTSTCCWPKRTRGRGGCFGSRTPMWTRPCSARWVKLCFMCDDQSEGVSEEVRYKDAPLQNVVRKGNLSIYRVFHISCLI